MMNLSKRGWIVITLLSACTLSSSNEGSGQYSIHSATDAELAAISISSDEISVRDADGQLIGVAKRSDKRKYYDPSNTMVYAVKLDDDGFKLRDGNEQLIWKIKLYEDKLKIANNEEMYSGYEVKLRDGKLKLERNETEIKSIRLSESTDWYDVEGRYKIQGFGQSLAAGILLIDDLKEREKFIIMAELAKRGR
ncbi:MAG: hypothetical protein JNK44_09640 [Cyclobacteriaceae bacterium]|nr:hypothetical protein [Cyclobacteriaceae bacterium]